MMTSFYNYVHFVKGPNAFYYNDVRQYKAQDPLEVDLQSKKYSLWKYVCKITVDRRIQQIKTVEIEEAPTW